VPLATVHKSLKKLQAGLIKDTVSPSPSFVDCTLPMNKFASRLIPFTNLGVAIDI
jgi:hypothetical protein